MSLAEKTAKGTMWVSIDRFTVMGCQFVSNLLLARLLTPDDFGLIVMITVFMAVSATLIDSGFGTALIQKKNPTQTDYSTVFYWNLALSLLLYAILFVAAPAIAAFYHSDQLTGITRAMALTLPANALMLIQNVRLRKELRFRTLALVNIGAYVSSAAIAVALAANGAGAYAIVAQSVLNALFIALALAVVTRWLPAATFSTEAFRALFSFGGFLLAASLLQEVCKNFIGVIMGRLFPAAQVGLYSQAQKLDQITSYSIPQIVVQVMYPVFSAMQDSAERLSATIETCLRILALCIFPVLTLLILLAPDIFTLLYGQRWIHAVPYFRILCVGGFFVCLQNIGFYAVAAHGHSRQLFHWSFAKWGVLIALILLASHWGMTALVWATVVSNANILLINAALCRRHIPGCTLGRQLRAVAVPAAACALLGSAACALLPAGWAAAAAFAAAYVAAAALLRFRAVADLRLFTLKLLHRQ